MLYIRNYGDGKASLSADQQLAFVKKCEVYIDKLKKENKLLAAQPIMREGCIISKSNDSWKATAVDPTKEIQVGYYHIMANNIDEAIEIAKQNPEFEFVASASIEVRPVKMKEERTDYVYPKSTST